MHQEEQSRERYVPEIPALTRVMVALFGHVPSSAFLPLMAMLPLAASDRGGARFTGRRPHDD